MGFYINPRNMTKEKFLKEAGLRISSDEAKEILRGDDPYLSVVALIDNRMFTAALIISSAQELEELLHDKRPITFYLMNRETAEAEVRDPSW